MPRIPHNTIEPTVPASPLHRCKACDYSYCHYYFEPKSSSSGIYYTQRRKLPKEKKIQTRTNTIELVDQLISITRECVQEKEKRIQLLNQLLEKEEAKEEPKEISNLCPICMDSQVDHALMCGHCFCDKCCLKMAKHNFSWTASNPFYKCPTCAREYQCRIKIYL